MLINKSGFIAYLIGSVYSPTELRLSKKLTYIHENHRSLCGKYSTGFWFKGDKYTYIESSILNLEYIPLVPPLHALMKEYLVERAEVEVEKCYVLSFFQNIVNNCKDDGHLYYLLPVGLHKHLHDVCITKSPLPPDDVDIIGYNEKGKSYLITRMMLELTGV